MQKLINWAVSQSDWACSALELPALEADADVVLQRWCVVAGGLGLILSRLRPTERSAHFAATHGLYVLIRRRLRQSQPVGAGADLLGDVMHEIAEVADPLTRRCLRAAFDASLGERAEVGAGAALSTSSGNSQPVSSLVSGSRTLLGDGRRSRNPNNAETSLIPEMLVERATALRKTIAAARGMGASSD
jgi:hypothetical protein